MTASLGAGGLTAAGLTAGGLAAGGHTGRFVAGGPTAGVFTSLIASWGAARPQSLQGKGCSLRLNQFLFMKNNPSREKYLFS